MLRPSSNRDFCSPCRGIAVAPEPEGDPLGASIAMSAVATILGNDLFEFFTHLAEMADDIECPGLRAGFGDVPQVDPAAAMRPEFAFLASPPKRRLP
jgi:hypothetical protein